MLNLQLTFVTIISVHFTWSFFFTISSIRSINNSLISRQTTIKPNLFSITPEGLAIKLSLILLLMFTFRLFAIRVPTGYFLFDQLHVFNNTFFFFVLLLLSYLLLTSNVFISWLSRVRVPIDYTCTLLTLLITAPTILLTSNFYSFFMIIELIGVCILAKISLLPLSYSLKDNSKGVIMTTPKSLILSIFAYYWMSFFSSIFLMIFVIFIIFSWGTADYFEINVLVSFTDVIAKSTGTEFYQLIGALFIFGFLLKAGSTPFHMYKVNLFQGLPIFSTIVYTFIFYLTYISYFAYLLPSVMYLTGTTGVILSLTMLIVGIVLLLGALFSNRYLKSFLALSSSINAAIILLLLFSCCFI